MEDKKAVIYGVRSGETYHYIGKTVQVNMNGEVPNSSVGRQYMNPELRQIFVENEVQIDRLGVCAENVWYDEKLKEVVAKHQEDHALLNAQWMLDGKRGLWEGTGGWWQGKTKDRHTIDRMSESKFRPVLEYDINGNFVRQWESKKAVSQAVFDDYKVINGGGRTKLYGVLSNKNPKLHLRHGSYWFNRSDFKRIPKTLDIEAMYAKYLKEHPKKVATHHMQYSVEHYVNGKLKKVYPNVVVASKRLGVHRTTISRICCGKKEIKNPCIDVRYGEKTLQPVLRSK